MTTLQNQPLWVNKIIFLFLLLLTISISTQQQDGLHPQIIFNIFIFTSLVSYPFILKKYGKKFFPNQLQSVFIKSCFIWFGLVLISTLIHNYQTATYTSLGSWEFSLISIFAFVFFVCMLINFIALSMKQLCYLFLIYTTLLIIPGLHSYWEDYYRLYGTYIHIPITYSCLIVTVFFILIFYILCSQKSQIKKNILIISPLLLLILVGVYEAETRTSWLALPAGLIFSIIVLKKNHKWIHIKYLVIMLITGIILTSIILYNSDRGKLAIKQVTSCLNDNQCATSVGYRLTMYKGSIELFLNNPLTGVGIDQFNESFDQTNAFRNNLSSDEARRHLYSFDQPHNAYLNYLSTAGILGFLGLIIFIFYFIFQLCIAFYRASDRWSIFLLGSTLFTWVSVLIYSLTDIGLTSPHQLLFSIIYTILALSKLKPSRT